MLILQLLSDGEFHSGEELGRALGISRAAIWKQIAGLRKRGLEVEVLPGKGYRLRTPFDAWRSDHIEQALAPPIRAKLSLIHVEQTVTSTNDVVAERMRARPCGAVVCIAEEQTAGRGRRGREWFSPWGRSFYGSIGWVFAEGLGALQGLSLAVGVAIIRALRRAGIEGVRLKWPNDLLAAGGKLGGVLIEVQAEAGGHCQVIVGIGINLSLPEEAADRLGRAVVDLASLTETRIDRNRLAALLVEEVILLLGDYPEAGFAGVQQEWLELDALRDEQVSVSGLGVAVEGRAQGVDEQGALLVQTAEGLVRVQAGEVSLRHGGQWMR